MKLTILSPSPKLQIQSAKKRPRRTRVERWPLQAAAALILVWFQACGSVILEQPVDSSEQGDPRSDHLEDTNVCGNGTVDAGESCDDGNTTDGDCCAATCQYEASGSSCNNGNSCTALGTCDGAGLCSAGDQNHCGNDLLDCGESNVDCGGNDCEGCESSTDYVHLEWDANTETDLAGYIVYWGTTSGVYSQASEVIPQGTEEFILDASRFPAGQTYFFAITALDLSGNESNPSNEVSTSFP